MVCISFKSYQCIINVYAIFPTAPTAVRDLQAAASSTESILITWNYPEYPNSELTEFVVYYRKNPSTIQMTPNILNDNFEERVVPIDMTRLDLTGLDVFTNYAIHMTVRGEGVEDAPIEIEISARTNAG